MIFSSHILSEVAAISDRVVVIHHGQIVLDDATETLNAQAAARGLDLEALVLEHVRAAEEPAP